ncbi:MAG: hypothetical protein Q7N87_02305 [Candidatus Uhrbacteria bacterium]|nr:hypothetical protein [Candidatus Uhrbacteria bacterium]
MPVDWCPNCLPTKRTTHLHLYIEYGIDLIVRGLYRVKNFLFQPFAKTHATHDPLWHLIVMGLKSVGIIRFVDPPDSSTIRNRSLIFLDEAKRRGIRVQAMKLLGQHVNDFRFFLNNRWHDFQGVPLVERVPPSNFDHKIFVKNFLEKNFFPIAQGRMFYRRSSAHAYAKHLGFPLVVKPVAGSLSHHLTCPVTNEAELDHAITIALQYQPAFVMEKFVEGNLYRATVINQKEALVCQKEIANVVGDGTSTIQKLVRQKNADPRRGETDQKNTTLHQIPMDDAVTQHLKNQGLTFDSVPLASQKIFLHKKPILSCGCDVIGCTSATHPETRELFLRIAKLFDLNLVGIDFLCSDITRSYREQQTAILEINTLPYIDMHQFPSHGEAHDVAKMVWDEVVKNYDPLN